MDNLLVYYNVLIISHMAVSPGIKSPPSPEAAYTLSVLRK